MMYEPAKVARLEAIARRHGHGVSPRCGKISHASAAAAWREAMAMVRRGTRQPDQDGRLRAYKCPNCNGYHVCKRPRAELERQDTEFA